MGYKPQATRAGQTIYMPLPMLKLSERYARKVNTSEVPLQGGVLVSTSTRGALSVTLNGIIVKNNPQDNSPITDVQAAKDEMMDFFINNDLPFTFYYSKSGAEINDVEYPPLGTRYYRNCYASDLSFDRSNKDRQEMLPYSLTLLIPDGIEWTA